MQAFRLHVCDNHMTLTLGHNVSKVAYLPFIMVGVIMIIFLSSYFDETLLL